MSEQSRPGRPSGRRTEIWQVLREAEGPLGIADLAAQLGVHPNTVRFHLDQLLAQGQVERVAPPRSGPGRPPLLFRAVVRMDPEGPRRYRLLAEVLAGALADQPDARARSVEAGRRWWGEHAPRFTARERELPAEPVARLGVLLDELGFAPEPPTSRGPEPHRVELGLRHCPFLDLTAQDTAARSEVICPIHLGLMQGALDDWDAGIAVERLEPMVEPDRCVAHLLASTG